MSALSDADLARWRMHSLVLDGPVLGGPLAVVEHLLAVQAENATQSRWAIACRASGVLDADVVAAIDEGELIRTHVLRPTWHDVRPADLRWLLELTGPRIRRSMRGLDRAHGITDEVVTASTEVVVSGLAGGSWTRGELGDRLVDEGLPGSGPPLGHLLGHLETLAVVCSGPLRDGEHTYVLVDERVAPAPARDRGEMLAELATRYVASHGPVTARDLAYWSHQTLTDARAGLVSAQEAGGVDSFDHDGRRWWSVGEPPPSSAVRQRAHVLQRLDECHNGVQDTRHLLDRARWVTEDRPPVGMVLLDAQIAGHMWRRTTSTALVVAVQPLRPLGDDELVAIDEEVARYAAFLGLEGRVELRRG